MKQKQALALQCGNDQTVPFVPGVQQVPVIRCCGETEILYACVLVANLMRGGLCKAAQLVDNSSDDDEELLDKLKAMCDTIERRLVVRDHCIDSRTGITVFDLVWEE